MSDFHFSNYQIERGTDYFLYIGELKNYGLNIYLKEALTRIHNRPFDFIAIVPDVFEQYNYDNLLVINPLAATLECQYGARVCCRISSQDFAACVSENDHVTGLVKRILDQQERLWIYMYESLEAMTLDLMPGVSILGPDKAVARQLNSKIHQYQALEQLLPVVDFRVCTSYTALLETTEPLWKKWIDGIFVSMEYSAAGINSTLARSRTDITQRFGPDQAPFIISRYMPHTHDPTVLAVVAGKADIYIAGIADQHIVGGNRFTGSSFPSVLPDHICDQLRDLTTTAGQWLADQGYRGIFGCDYIVDDQERIHFLEINARKQGTTLEFCCTLEQTLPPGSPMLPELEFYSVAQGSFPEGTLEMDANLKNLHWGTYNYKIHENVYTNGYFPQYVRERQAFEKVAQGKLKKDFMILEHAGSDFIVAEGSFIGRIVALGDNHASVRQGLSQGRRALETTFEQKKISSWIQPVGQGDLPMRKDEVKANDLDAFTLALFEQLFETSPAAGSGMIADGDLARAHELKLKSETGCLTAPIIDLFRYLLGQKREKGLPPDALGISKAELLSLADKHARLDEHAVTVGGRLNQALSIVAGAEKRVEGYLARKSLEAPSGLELWEDIQASMQRIKSFFGMRDDEWHSYTGQLRNCIDSVDKLAEVIDLPAETITEIARVTQSYRMRLTPYYASLIQPGQLNDPILLQSVPTSEMVDNVGVEIPPVAADHSPARLVDQFYPRVVTIKVTNMCAMYCTHCLRLAHIGKKDRIYPAEAYQEAIDYIRNNPLIRDVLITGGDAFVLPNKIIKDLLRQLDDIGHLKLKRLGTRIPVTAPQRIDEELLEILAESNDKKPVRVVTQINTAQEITPVSREAFRKISKSVAAVLNQAVLLKGVNDSRVKMWKLCETIQESYVRPYYLFNCSYRNPQFAHFRVPVEKGRDIVESMYGNISGDAIPRYIATAGGKIPLHRSNVIGAENGDVVLKKPWSGEDVKYPDADPAVYADKNFSFRKP